MTFGTSNFQETGRSACAEVEAVAVVSGEAGADGVCAMHGRTTAMTVISSAIRRSFSRHSHISTPKWLRPTPRLRWLIYYTPMREGLRFHNCSRSPYLLY